jgi:hypothetical protein
MAMRRSIGLWAVMSLAPLLVSFVSPSWAWWRGGYRGPGIGVYLSPGPWWGYGYYDPYYGYPGNPYYPYAYSPYDVPYTYALPGVTPASRETQGSADDSRHDLKFLDTQIARARDRVEYEYEDGDITRAERDAELDRLVGIKKEARAEAKVNGGTLTGDQERELLQLLRSGGTVSGSSAPRAPENSDRGLKKVNDEVSRLQGLLDKKLAAGDITKAQHDGMRDYLDRTEKQVQSDAAANDGTLTPDQENTVLQQLQRASDSLTKNFVVN